MAVNFGKEVGSRDVERDTPGEREGVLELGFEEAGKGDAEQSRAAENSGSSDGVLARLTASQNHGGDGETFGEFVEKDGDENDSAEPGGNEEAGGDSYAVEEGVNAEAEEDGAAGMAVFELFVVSLFTEVEVRGDGVFEQMDEKETDKDVEEGTLPRETDRFGKNFDKDYGEHVAGAEREEILEVLAGPFFADDEIAAEEIACGGD